MRSEMIKRLLDEGVAADDGSDVVASVAVRALASLFAELRPLIGMLALRALYSRSLHLAHDSFQRPSANLVSEDELLIHLQQDLVSRQPADARRAAQSLLHALANLLISLIGEPLTNRLLHKAWGNLSVGKPSEVKAP
jgi:hypothetical protein